MIPPRPVVLQEMHVVACYFSDSMPALPSSELRRKDLGASDCVECQCRRRRGAITTLCDGNGIWSS